MASFRIADPAAPAGLPAYPCDDGRQLRVWCDACNRWHYHGAAVAGHRVAHCCPDSPHRAAGYVLVPTEVTP
jgi:hypothetical protein